MKMLCIRGRQHPFHTGLVAGQVYEVYPHPFACPRCPRQPVAAEGSEFLRDIRIKCWICGMRTQLGKGPVPWNPNRFIPWPDAPSISEEEANELYIDKPLVEEYL